jgi:hypothetical protein
VDNEAKIRLLAELMVQKHGEDALAVVNERIRGRLLAQDYPLAALWSLVAGTVHAARPNAKPRRRNHQWVQQVAAGVLATMAAHGE